MKIEMDIKELATLIDLIREQRDFVGSADDLANELAKSVPQKVVEQLSRRI